MNRTTVLLLLIGSAVLVIALSRYAPVETHSAVPWKVEHSNNGQINAFGIILGQTTLDDALHTFSRQGHHKILVDQEQKLKLVSLFKNISFDGLIADIELEYKVSRDELQKLLQGKTSPLQTIEIKAAQLASVRNAVVSRLSYRPSIDYSEDTILQRFGYPDIKEDLGNRTHRWIYKDMHLQIYINDDNTERLIYTESIPGI